MRKLTIIIAIFTVLILSSCSRGGNENDFYTICFEKSAFEMQINGVDYKGIMNFDNNILNVDITGPDELDNISFIIDQSGVVCCDDDLKCSYPSGDFDGSFVFSGLYDLIVSSSGSEEFRQEKGLCVFEKNGGILRADKSGNPVSAQINENTIIFT